MWLRSIFVRPCSLSYSRWQSRWRWRGDDNDDDDADDYDYAHLCVMLCYDGGHILRGKAWLLFPQTDQSLLLFVGRQVYWNVNQIRSLWLTTYFRLRLFLWRLRLPKLIYMTWLTGCHKWPFSKNVTWLRGCNKWPFSKTWHDSRAAMNGDLSAKTWRDSRAATNDLSAKMWRDSRGVPNDLLDV